MHHQKWIELPPPDDICDLPGLANLVVILLGIPPERRCDVVVVDFASFLAQDTQVLLQDQREVVSGRWLAAIIKTNNGPDCLEIRN